MLSHPCAVGSIIDPFDTLRKFILILFLLTFLICCYAQSKMDSLIIKKVWIEGNRKTKSQIIFRELSFQENDIYARAAFDSLFEWNRNRIYNTNLFNSVEMSFINEKDGEIEVKITVDERWYLYPTPIFKLIDRNFNDWWVNRNRDLSRVNYGIRLSQFNFRGRGEILRVVLQSGFTTALGLQYSIPYIDKKQNQGLHFNLSYFEAKNVAYTTSEGIQRFTSDIESDLKQVYFNSIRHSYRTSFYTFHTTSLGHYHIKIADTLTLLNPNYLGDSRTLQRHFFIGYSFRYDKRNNVNYPTRGGRILANIFKHGLGIYQDGVDYWRTRLKMSKYWDLDNKFYAASDVSIFSTFPANRDYFNYYKIGLLLEALRGYDLNIIEGSSYIIQRNEVKYQFFGRKYDISRVMPIRQFQTFPMNIYWKVFFDQGYAKGYPNYNGSEPLSDSYLYSFGTGLDFVVVNDITLRLELARNAQNQNYFFINFLSLL